MTTTRRGPGENAEGPPTPREREELSAAMWKEKYLAERRHAKHWEKLCKQNMRRLRNIRKQLESLSDTDERN